MNNTTNTTSSKNVPVVKFHLSTEPIPNDGDCFFHCMSRILKEDRGVLREVVVDEILRNQDIIATWVLLFREARDQLFYQQQKQAQMNPLTQGGRQWSDDEKGSFSIMQEYGHVSFIVEEQLDINNVEVIHRLKQVMMTPKYFFGEQQAVEILEHHYQIGITIVNPKDENPAQGRRNPLHILSDFLETRGLPPCQFPRICFLSLFHGHYQPIRVNNEYVHPSPNFPHRDFPRKNEHSSR